MASMEPVQYACVGVMLAVAVLVYVDARFSEAVVGLYLYVFVLCAVGATFKGVGGQGWEAVVGGGGAV